MSYEIIVEFEDDEIHERSFHDIKPYTTEYFSDVMDEGIIYDLGEENDCDIDRFFDEDNYFEANEVIRSLRKMQAIIAMADDYFDGGTEKINNDIDTVIEVLNYAIKHNSKVRLTWF